MAKRINYYHEAINEIIDGLNQGGVEGEARIWQVMSWAEATLMNDKEREALIRLCYTAIDRIE